MQAGIGNVVVGSLFATAQSVAMGGAIPAAITAIGAGVAGVGGAAVGATAVGATIASASMGAASAVGAGLGTAAAGVVGKVAAIGAASAVGPHRRCCRRCCRQGRCHRRRLITGHRCCCRRCCWQRRGHGCRRYCCRGRSPLTSFPISHSPFPAASCHHCARVA
jgi:hypothetical protein